MKHRLPFVVEAGCERDLVRWANSHRPTLDAKLECCGGVLLRGFDVAAEAPFRDFVRTFSSDILEYEHPSTPRTALGQGIYTATEYPAGLTIPLHNENSYQKDWPLWLLFCCLEPAQGGGGQTLLANTLNVTHRIDPAIRRKFIEKNVMYIRNYRKDIDLPWQRVFQTESKLDVEDYCRRNEIVFKWTSTDSLRTRQVCQSFARHPRTGDKLWFNQAHLFHPSALDQRTRKAMSDMFEEEDFPRNAVYGDGSKIVESELENVREAFRQETITFEWQRGDVLIVDNMLVSHGRNPYKGKRRVLVAMCDACSSRITPQTKI